MLALVLKDLYEQRTNILFFLAFPALGYLVGPPLYGAFLILLPWSIAIRATYAEDRGGLEFLCSLPFSRNQIVTAKFLLVLLLLLLGVGEVVLVSALPPLEGTQPVPDQALWVMPVTVAGFAAVLTGAFLNLFFRIGYIRALNYSRLLALLPLALLIPQVQQIVLKSGVQLFLTSDPRRLALWVLAGSLVVYLALLLDARRVFGQKDIA